MADLFSQIPFAVLDKAGRCGTVNHDKPGPKSRQSRYLDAFYGEDEVRPRDALKEEEEPTKKQLIISPSPLLDEATIFDDSLNEQITSSFQDPPKRTVETYNAKIQTSPKKMISREVQTVESMLTRPLSTSDNDIHRANMQTYAPITPIPKCTDGSNPPLRIGLTLRGKKRRVYYPDLEDVENHNV